ncbi:hypothetical protein MtrunA17_Chr8g0383581 [Medicago truncatula]|uniref:Transmembrane protein n=1 Tax=Medicago truncatula TaxID=3880 RepID=A0A396GWQ5_MEDTR|nr:hypothetical protein MtrunA17_Chr8g0383581 [Medicago truncatula]
MKDRITYWKFGISDRFLSSKVEFKRLDCIGECGARTKHQHIFLRICMNKISRVFFDGRNLIYCLIAAANFKIIIVVGIIPKIRQKTA